MLKDDVVCPICHLCFDFNIQDKLVCTNCGHNFNFINGIPDLKLANGELSGKEQAELEFWAPKTIPGEQVNLEAFYHCSLIEDYNKENDLIIDFNNKDKMLLDLGAGPYGGSITGYKSKRKYSIDNLAVEYSKYFNLKQFTTNYIAASAENLPFKDESVDYIIANNSLDHVSNIFKVFYEISRVLKKDGLLLFLVYFNSMPFTETEPFVFDNDFIHNDLKLFFNIKAQSIELFQEKSYGDGLYHAICSKKEHITFKKAHLLDKYTTFIESYCKAAKSYTDKDCKLSFKLTQEAIENYLKMNIQDEYRLLLLKMKLIALSNVDKIYQEFKIIDRNYYSNDIWILEIAHKVSLDVLNAEKFDLAEEFIINNLELARKTNYKYREATSLFFLGEIYRKTDNIEKAKEHYQKCLDILPEHKLAKNYLDILKNL